MNEVEAQPHRHSAALIMLAVKVKFIKGLHKMPTLIKFKTSYDFYLVIM
jgi:hypothetical protein